MSDRSGVSPAVRFLRVFQESSGGRTKTSGIAGQAGWRVISAGFARTPACFTGLELQKGRPRDMQEFGVLAREARD